jgi:hypothetical protein
MLMLLLFFACSLQFSGYWTQDARMRSARMNAKIYKKHQHFNANKLYLPCVDLVAGAAARLRWFGSEAATESPRSKARSAPLHRSGTDTQRTTFVAPVEHSRSL